MVKNDIDTRIEEIASNAEGVACILGILGEDASRYSNHLGNSAYLMQTVCRQISEELYKIFDELRGGKWENWHYKCGVCVFARKNIAPNILLCK